MVDPSYRRPPPPDPTILHSMNRSFSPIGYSNHPSTHPSIASQWQPDPSAHYQESYQNSVQDNGYTPPAAHSRNYSNTGYTDDEEEMDIGYDEASPEDDFEYRHSEAFDMEPPPTVPLYSAVENSPPPKRGFAKGFMRGLKNFPKAVFRYGDKRKPPLSQPGGFVIPDQPPFMTSTPPAPGPSSLQFHSPYEFPTPSFPSSQHRFSERPPPISEESYISGGQDSPGDPRRQAPELVVTGPSGHLEQLPEEQASFGESPPARPHMPMHGSITAINYTNTQSQTPGPHVSMLPSQTTEMPMGIIQSPLLERPVNRPVNRPAVAPERDSAPPPTVSSTNIPEESTHARSTGRNYKRVSRTDRTSYRSSAYPSTYTNTQSFDDLNPVLRFFQRLADMPWVARNRVTTDYRPPSTKGGRSRRGVDPKMSGKQCWYHPPSQVDISGNPPSRSSTVSAPVRRHSDDGGHGHRRHRSDGSKSRRTSNGRRPKRKRANTISSEDRPPVPPLPSYFQPYGYIPYPYPPQHPLPGQPPPDQRAGSNAPTPRPSRHNSTNHSNHNSTHHGIPPVPPLSHAHPALMQMPIIPVAASPPVIHGAPANRYTPQPFSPPGSMPYPLYIIPSSDPAFSNSGNGSGSGGSGQAVVGWVPVPLGFDAITGAVGGGYPQPHMQMPTPPTAARMGAGTQVDGQ